MSKKAVEIAVPAFEGPLDLLLHLIDRNELDITALSLTSITDQYLQQVESLKENRVSQMIDFIVIGARLMVIKSRALLPAPPVQLEEGEEEEDPAEALVRQLRLYKMFKDSAETLQKRHTDGLRTYLRVAPPRKKSAAKLDLTGVTLDTLYQAMQRVQLRLANREESISVVAPRRITIEGQITKLRVAVKQQPSLDFDTLLSEKVSPAQLSVTLLAVLELIKRREVEAHQTALFGPIEIHKT